MLPVIFFIAALLASGQALNAKQKKDEIDRQVQNIMRCTRIPAVSLSVISLDEQQFIYNRAYGTLDVGTGQRPTTQDAFCIGGGTQAFAAVLLANLIDANENVTWDTPVQDILGSRVVLKESYVGDHLTLKDIFAMRSGLSDMDIVPWVKPYDVDTLIRNLRYVPFSAGFREKYVHNDILFSLVIKVSEELGQDNWFNLIRRHILRPLQMTQTTFIGTNNLDGGVNLAKGTVYYSGNDLRDLPESVFNGLELIAPSATICTSADDFSRWLRFLLYEGRSMTNTQLIRKENLEMLYEPIAPRGHGNPDVEGFPEPDLAVGYYRNQNALGFITGSFMGLPFVSQDGSLPGYQSLATIIPASKIAVYVSFTGDERPKNFAAKVLLNQLGLDIVRNNQVWFKGRRVCDIIDSMARLFDEPADNDGTRNIVRTSRKVHRSLEEYENTYKNWAFGELSVKVDNESKSDALTLTYGEGMYVLEPTNVNDTFQLNADVGDLMFSTRADHYRDVNRMFADFSFDERDEDERIYKVTISGFSDESVEFHVNPREPSYDDGRAHPATCGSQGLAATSSASLGAIFTILFIVTLLGR